jgi:hypothetical protein
LTINKGNIKMTTLNGFSIDTLNEELNDLGFDSTKDKDLAIQVILASVKTAEHFTAIICNLYRGKCTPEQVQAHISEVYPTATQRTAAHHMCRFRHPEKYEPKYQPRYALSGGRTAKAPTVNITPELTAAMDKLRRK